MTITLYGGSKDKKLGFCKVNLYKIATGAIHNNFILLSSSGSPGRISFDVKMCQYFSMIIKSCVLIGKLNENLQEKHYFYSMTLLDGENRIESEHSADFENCFLNMSMKDESEINKKSRSGSTHSVIDTTKGQESPKKSTFSFSSNLKLSVAEEREPLKMPKSSIKVKDINK